MADTLEERLSLCEDHMPSQEQLDNLERRVRELEEGMRINLAIQKIFHNRISRLENK